MQISGSSACLWIDGSNTVIFIKYCTKKKRTSIWMFFSSAISLFSGEDFFPVWFFYAEVQNKQKSGQRHNDMKQDHKGMCAKKKTESIYKGEDDGDGSYR